MRKPVSILLAIGFVLCCAFLIGIQSQDVHAQESNPPSASLLYPANNNYYSYLNLINASASDDTNISEVYSYVLGLQYTKLPENISEQSCAYSSSKDMIYCFGGVNQTGSPTGDIDYILSYNYTSSEIVKMGARFPTPITDFSCVEHTANGKIYCIGGLDNGTNPDDWSVRTVYEYDPSLDSLTLKGATLTENYSDLSCVDDDATGKIFCFGGYNFATSEDTDAVHMYDPDADNMTVVANLSSGRSGFSCAHDPYSELIYCFGGYNQRNNNTRLSEIVSFNTTDDSLSYVSDLPHNLTLLSCAPDVQNGRIYCFGGNNGTELAGPPYGRQFDSIIEFDTQTKVASELGIRMRYRMNSQSCAAIYNGEIFCLGGYAYDFNQQNIDEIFSFNAFRLNHTTGNEYVYSGFFLPDAGYNITVRAIDYYSNSFETPMMNFGIDTVYPTWLQAPHGLAFLNNSGWAVKWNASDNIGIDTFIINDTNDFSISTVGLMTNKTKVPGNYSVNISVNDTSGNGISQIIIVEIKESPDLIPPAWSQTPYSLSYFNSSGWAVKWNATDNKAIDVYFINDSNDFTMSSTGLMTNKTRTPGNYSVNVSVNDTSGNSISQIIIVEIRNEPDMILPTWSQVPYSVAFFNNSAWAVQWNATDNKAIDRYSINDTNDFFISPTGLMTNKTKLPGNYSVNISVNDTSGNEISAIISVEIMNYILPDTTPPTWVQAPYNLSYLNNTGWSVKWNATDNAAVDSYTINDSPNFYMSPNGMMTNRTKTPGNYSVNVSVNDTSNNNLSSVIIVEIKAYADLQPPAWAQQPYNFSVLEGTQVSVQWNATDNTAVDRYYIDDTQNFSMATNGTMYNATSLSPGNYTLHLYANDTFNNTNTATIIVEINSVPVIPNVTSMYPANASTISYSTDVYFNFTASSSVTGNYSFDGGAAKDLGASSASFSSLLNGSVNSSDIANGIMSNGNHNITLRITNTYNNTITNQYRFTVNDSNPPTIYNLSVDNTHSGSSTGVAIVAVRMSEYGYCWISTNSSLNASSGMNMTAYGATGMTGGLAKTLTYNIPFSSSTTLPARYITCADALGNNMSTANTTGPIDVTVTSGGNPPSGGGGGGGAPPSNVTTEGISIVSTIPDGVSISIPAVTAGKEANTSTLSITGLDLSLIEFTTKGTLENIGMNIIKTGTTGDVPPGNVYQGFRIELLNFSDSDLNSTLIHFKVSKRWMAGNNVTTDMIRLYRKQGTTWMPYDAILDGQDTSYFKFISSTPGFSLFAIAAQQAAKGTKPGAAGNNASNGNATKPPAAPPKVEELGEQKTVTLLTNKTPMDWTWWTATAIIFAIVLILYILRKRQVRKHKLFKDNGAVNLEEISKETKK